MPCGAAAQTVAESAGVTLSPVSEEQSVTDVLAKVASGEADAGLVYVTDVIAAGDDVQGIEFPESSAAVNVYPIATVADSENADLAEEFVELVLGDDGQHDPRRRRLRAGAVTWASTELTRAPGSACPAGSTCRRSRERRSCCSRWSRSCCAPRGAASSS